jgi:methionine-rich copper-binding protein CopC
MTENGSDMQLEVGYLSTSNSLSVHYQALSAGESSVNLVDLSGKSVFNESIGTTQVGENKKAVKLPSDLKAGIYIVHLNVNNNFTSKKIYIQ